MLYDYLLTLLRIEVINPQQDSDESMSSSVVIMPDPTLSQTSPSAPAVDRTISSSPTIHTEQLSDDDALSDSSSISLISVTSSEDEEDAGLWQASRAQATADYVAEHRSNALDYVLLYDDNTSEEE